MKKPLADRKRDDADTGSNQYLCVSSLAPHALFALIFVRRTWRLYIVLHSKLRGAPNHVLRKPAKVRLNVLGGGA